jgi:hypothetical protein
MALSQIFREIERNYRNHLFFLYEEKNETKVLNLLQIALESFYIFTHEINVVWNFADRYGWH